MSSKSKSDTEPLPASILKRYKFRREIGHGSYGTVWAATDLENQTDVAIKKIGARNFAETILAKRALREMLLLQHLNGHDSITSFIDVEINDPLNFNELYIVEGLMEADLNQIIKSQQPLTEQHHQYFLYQLLRGLKWMHSANVLHRDLKPGNLLVNSDCELRICDFGLARGSVEGQVIYKNTEYVATRYYRAPEVVLSPTHYTKALDMWSVGCIFGELLGGKVMFKGRDYIDQLQKIFEVLGTPEDLILGSLCSQRVLKYVQTWPKRQKIPFAKLFPKAQTQAVDLLERLLEFNPKKRITAEEALRHPFFAGYHQPDDEPNHPRLFDFSFERAETIDEIKRLIVDAVTKHKQERMLKRNGDVLHSPTHPSAHPSLSDSDREKIFKVPRYEAEEGVDVPGSIEEELSMRELKLQD